MTGGPMSPATPNTRELAARESNGIYVLLLWHPREDAITVSVEDDRRGDRFRIAVASNRALDAFYHPFAYAA
jgi:hypothetical protein